MSRLSLIRNRVGLVPVAVSRLGVLGMAAVLGSGCGSPQPEIDATVPPAEVSEGPAAGELPKGMPSNTSMGMQIDPKTGRPSGPPPGASQ